MPLDTDVKAEIIEKYKRAEGDTGSVEVQVALISKRIADLTEHLKVHTHDHACRRGLRQLAGRRVRLLRYLRGKDESRYVALIAALGLRR